MLLKLNKSLIGIGAVIFGFWWDGITAFQHTMFKIKFPFWDARGFW